MSRTKPSPATARAQAAKPEPTKRAARSKAARDTQVQNRTPAKPTSDRGRRIRDIALVALEIEDVTRELHSEHGIPDVDQARQLACAAAVVNALRVGLGDIQSELSSLAAAEAFKDGDQ